MSATSRLRLQHKLGLTQLSPSPCGRGAGGRGSPAHDLLNMITPARHA
jgi:hypothetical protein